MNRTFSLTGILLATAWLSACGELPKDAQTAAVVEAAAASVESQTTSDTMSYEVAIAIAAANRKHALRDCEARAADERKSCRDEIESDWDIAKAALSDLRGDQG